MVLRALAVMLLAALAGCGRSEGGVGGSDRITVVAYPLELDAGCRDGKAKLYDQCTDQRNIFAAALQEANTSGKTLLVSFGAEWCIWCHVFKKYVDGVTGEFTYTFGESAESARRTAKLREETGYSVKSEAAHLRDAVREDFVLAHIDYEFAPGGLEVLAASRADVHFDDWVPFIFVVDESGEFVAALDHKEIEVRRDGDRDWFRGYDRARLAEELSDLRDLARAKRQSGSERP